jgi:hypothetical protein
VGSDQLVTSYTLTRSLPTSDPEIYELRPLPSVLLDRQGQCRIPYVLAMFHGRPTNYRIRKRNDRHQTADANPCHLDWVEHSELERVSDDSYPTNLLKDLECRLNGET